ncbi:MAG: hypothetical protein IT204_15345 [Fimbriimonadaceae bacterium]|nr:hypothetical protein [Fimbriimonadaceae bacterium]
MWYRWAVICGCCWFLPSRAMPTLEASWEPAATAACGDLAPGQLLLTNRGDRALLVQSVASPDDPGAGLVELTRSFYGALQVDGDRWLYRAHVRNTAGPFSLGLVLPRETLRLAWDLRLVTPLVRLGLTVQQAAQPYDGSAASLAPFRVMVGTGPSKAGPLEFEPFSADRWAPVATRTARVTDDVDAETRWTVVVGNAPDEPLAVSLPVVVPPGFDLAAATARAAELAPGPADRRGLAWCSKLRAWVVSEPTRTWLLRSPAQGEAGPLIAAVDPEVLTALDRTGRVVFRLGQPRRHGGAEQDGGWKLAGRWPVTRREVVEEVIDPEAASAHWDQLVTVEAADFEDFVRAMQPHQTRLRHFRQPIGSGYFALERG